MNELNIVRPRLAFEREFGQYRNWWARDPRIAGNPLTILLNLLSHDPQRMPTQLEARKSLGLGVHAWQSGKKALLECGFLVEVRDRYPLSHVDAEGRPKGGQRRFRLFLQDPEQGVSLPASEAVIELNEPYEEYLDSLEAQRAAAETRESKPLIGASADYPHTEDYSSTAENPHTEDYPHTEDNPQSFIGRENWIGQEGLDRSFQSVHSGPGEGAGARDVGAPSAPALLTPDRSERPSAPDADRVDPELRAIHPTLSVQALREELGGRVDLATIDLVRASREILGRATQDLTYAPSYVAVAIAKTPSRYLHSRTPYQASVKSKPAAESALRRAQQVSSREACAAGDHDWGPESWGEASRSHCIRPDCGASRAALDTVFAQLLDDLERPSAPTHHGGAPWGV